MEFGTDDETNLIKLFFIFAMGQSKLALFNQLLLLLMLLYYW